MFRFGEPQYLYLLLLLLPLAVLCIYADYRKRKRLKAYGEYKLLKNLMPDYSRMRGRIKLFLQLLAFVSIVFMLARPQFGTTEEEVKRKGIETVVALDISKSMLAADVSPDRLRKSKQLISRLLDNAENDKIAFIVFAGEAFTQLPMTSDYLSAKMFLETIHPDFIATQGTNIAGAIQLGLKSFTPNEGVGKAIVLITDGENHEAGATEAAEEAAKAGVHVFVLGVGTTTGAPLFFEGSNEVRRDNEGNPIMTRLNEEMCKSLAQAGKGMYLHVDNTNAAEKLLKTEIEKLAKGDVASKVYKDYDEQFAVVAVLAILFLILDSIILGKKNRLLAKIKLFQ